LINEVLDVSRVARGLSGRRVHRGYDGCRTIAPTCRAHIEDNVSNLRLVERILARQPELTVMGAMQGSLGIDLASGRAELADHRPETARRFLRASAPMTRLRAG